jgi:8-hydroxy-5-deazaflavin:NADPH oxidoreductase
VRVAILGAGRLGGALARRFGADDHEVVVAARRAREELAQEVERWPGVRAGDRTDLATAEVVVLAFPWRAYPDALEGLLLPGVVVVDATNPFSEDFTVLDAGPRGSTGEIAAQLPGAHVVKAWNTLPAERYEEPVDLTVPHRQRLGVPIAGDDQDAKDLVRDLTGELGHVGVDVGSLDDGRRWMQPQCPLFMVPLAADDLRARVSALRGS